MSIASGPTGAPEPVGHRFLTWPSTEIGRRAAWLCAAVVGLWAVDGALAALGASDWGDAARLVLALSSALGMVVAVLALVLTVRALRKGDRSIVLLWPLVLGALALMFVVGELAFPH